MLMSTPKAEVGRGAGQGKSTLGLKPPSNSGDEEYLCRAAAWLSWKLAGEIGEKPASEPMLAWLPQCGGYGAAINAERVDAACFAFTIACSPDAAFTIAFSSSACCCRSFALSFLSFRSADEICLACSLFSHSAEDMSYGLVGGALGFLAFFSAGLSP